MNKEDLKTLATWTKQQAEQAIEQGMTHEEAMIYFQDKIISFYRKQKYFPKQKKEIKNLKICDNCIRLEHFMRRGFMFWCVAWEKYRNPKSKPLIPENEPGNCWVGIDEAI